MANDTEGQLVDIWNDEEESSGVKGWLEENVSRKGLSKLYSKASEYQEREMSEEVIPGLTQGQLYEGIIGTVGGVDFTSYKKAAKAIQASTALKRMSKHKRMKEGIDNGSLLFANKKWQKLIDEGKMSISESGDIWSRAGGTKGLMAKTGNVYKESQFERYDDFYKLQGELLKDYDKMWKSLTPKEKAWAKEFGKSSIMTKSLEDIVLKLEKLLPGD